MVIAVISFSLLQHPHIDLKRKIRQTIFIAPKSHISSKTKGIDIGHRATYTQQRKAELEN